MRRCRLCFKLVFGLSVLTTVFIFVHMHSKTQSHLVVYEDRKSQLNTVVNDNNKTKSDIVLDKHHKTLSNTDVVEQHQHEQNEVRSALGNIHVFQAPRIFNNSAIQSSNVRATTTSKDDSERNTVKLRKPGPQKKSRYVHQVLNHYQPTQSLQNVNRSLLQNIYYKTPFMKFTSKRPCSTLHEKIQYIPDGLIYNQSLLNVSFHADTKPLIPKILHQTWDTYDIPQQAALYVKSVLQLHPEWDYWFWTQKDIQCYFRHKHGEYLDLLNSYPNVQHRANVMRYFTLYDYGGVYMDIDIQALRPMDVWRYLGHAIISQETYEHTYILHKIPYPNLMNTVMAARPGHPYFKLVQEMLPAFNRTCRSSRLYSTGVFFIESVFQTYMNKLVLEPSVKEEDLVTVINPIYWLPTHTQNTEKIMKGTCLRTQRANAHVIDLCRAFNNRSYGNVHGEDSFLKHHWADSLQKYSPFKKSNIKVSMFDLFPTLVPVHEKLGLKCDF